jgi:hypothetical protein
MVKAAFDLEHHQPLKSPHHFRRFDTSASASGSSDGYLVSSARREILAPSQSERAKAAFLA